jgi:hypothetical protein
MYKILLSAESDKKPVRNCLQKDAIKGIISLTIRPWHNLSRVYPVKYSFYRGNLVNNFFNKVDVEVRSEGLHLIIL